MWIEVSEDDVKVILTGLVLYCNTLAGAPGVDWQRGIEIQQKLYKLLAGKEAP